MSYVLSALGERLDLELVQGDAFARTLTYKVNGAVTNITGYIFASQIRDEDGTLAATLTCTIVNAAAGTFSIGLTGAQTAALETGRPYVYDLKVTISGVTMQLLRGFVTIFDEATI